MCRVGVGWEPLDDIVKRLVDELARPGAKLVQADVERDRGRAGARHSAEAELELEAGGAQGDTLTPANRHGPRREGSATAAIYEFVPRKKDGPEPVQFPGGGKTVAEDERHAPENLLNGVLLNLTTRQTVPLRIAQRAKR